ncbi:MAG: hypothetical protein GF317_05470 [Candidatus Lokiarchaeota archaeon]|nr:hypothetical protein [Candidatus Lokiarchaeota archaeon]MBD3199256.1 hypothetical protein [Candidatus Lokiarchaeota archaeon]
MAYNAIFHPEKDRKITVKRPSLQKIRNELRKLLFKRINNKILQLLALKQERRELYYTRNISEEKYFEIIKPIQTKIQQLMKSLDESIVLCHTCGDLEGNRIYRNKDKTWYCLRCYEILERSDRKEFEALTRLD